MKKSSLAVIILLSGLVGFAWFSHFNNLLNRSYDASTSMQNAAEHMEKGLYQKAIMEYEDALAIREENETHRRMVEAYRLGYEDGVITAKEYSAAMLAYCQTYPEDLESWEILLTFDLENSSYDTAFTSAEACLESGAAGETLNSLINRARYAFKVSSKTYVDFTRNHEGYYSVADSDGWGVLEPNGTRSVGCDYQYISPFGENSTALYVSSRDARLIDEEGIVEAILPGDLTQTGAWWGGMLPVCTGEGVWKYLDCATGVYLPDSYQQASGFSDGIAAVRKDSGWMLIDEDGNSASEMMFDDIKLFRDGSFRYKDIMIASVNGVYSIYDEDKAVEGFTCTDADVYLGSYIAFRDDSGKWGYVNRKGEVVIEPAFEEARSFCRGIAAVSNGETWGFIDRDGTLVIDYQFLDADYFTNDGVCMVSTLTGEYYPITLRFPEVMK